MNPPTIYRNDDGTCRIQWNDFAREPNGYPVAAEILEQMVRTHNEAARFSSGLERLANGEPLGVDCQTYARNILYGIGEG